MSSVRPRILIVVAFLTLLAANPSRTAAMDEDSDYLVSTEWLSERLSQPNLVILHVAKDDAGYLEGHIPGARLAEWGDFVVTKDGVPNELPEPATLETWIRGLGITDSSQIVLYDEEKGMSAARAFFTLDSIGLGDQSALLDGQLKTWKAEGRPLSTEPATVEPSKWKIEKGAGQHIARQEEILSILSHSDTKGNPKLLDARSKDYFEGTKKSDSAARAGRLPEAIQMDWDEALREGDLPLFKSPSDLKQLLGEKGVGEKDPVITYCNTGRSASHLYFTLRHLGYDTRLYDGSMSEWTMDETHPVEVGSATE
ncbi:MAG: sulfurtransferase [Candidatus Omnitrophica bacterium]|nr:sulfurtransferase [Candidatus Omnitrophota bacterium]